MATRKYPSQGLIICKVCSNAAQPHKVYKLLCGTCSKHRQVEYQRAYRARSQKLAKPVVCKGCGKQFDTGQTHGRMWRCPDCLAAYQQEYAAKDRKRHAQYSRNYRTRLGQTYRQRLVDRRKAIVAGLDPEGLTAFREAEKAKTKRLSAILKNEVFEGYGGWRCVCCGEEERSFLTIDHMENNGSKMRREGIHGHSTQFYRWLKKGGFPSGFQVLCMNCQFGKRMNKGICPHQARRNDYPERE